MTRTRPTWFRSKIARLLLVAAICPPLAYVGFVLGFWASWYGGDHDVGSAFMSLIYIPLFVLLLEGGAIVLIMRIGRDPSTK